MKTLLKRQLLSSRPFLLPAQKYFSNTVFKIPTIESVPSLNKFAAASTPSDLYQLYKTLLKQGVSTEEQASSA